MITVEENNYYLAQYGQRIRNDMKRGTSLKTVKEQIKYRNELANQIYKEMKQGKRFGV